MVRNKEEKKGQLRKGIKEIGKKVSEEEEKDQKAVKWTKERK